MFVEFNMVIPERQAHIYDEREVETNDDGEDDGIVQLRPNQAQAQGEATTPTTVNTATIKNFYQRKKRQDGTRPVGTRINFMNGSGMAVTDTYAEVVAKLNG